MLQNALVKLYEKLQEHCGLNHDNTAENGLVDILIKSLYGT